MPASTATASTPPPEPAVVEGDPLSEHPALVKIRVLNRGAFGPHYLCWHRSTNRQVDVRLLPRPRTRTEAEALADQLMDHRTCSGHPHVALLLGVLVAQQTVAVLMEPIDGGTLAGLVSSKAAAASSVGLTEQRARALMQQLMVAVDYCHRRGVALYNMRLDNIAVSNFAEKPTVRICDFGTSFAAPATDAGMSTEGAEMPFLQYLGPEFTCNDRDLDMEADVFSCGVILYALLSGGRFPFKRAGEEDTMSTGLRTNVEKWRAVAGNIAPLPQVSPPCWHLIKAMLRSEISERPNVAEVLRHPWMLSDMPPDLAALNERLLQDPPRAAPGAIGGWSTPVIPTPEINAADLLRAHIHPDAAAVDVGQA